MSWVPHCAASTSLCAGRTTLLSSSPQPNTQKPARSTGFITLRAPGLTPHPQLVEIRMPGIHCPTAVSRSLFFLMSHPKNLTARVGLESRTLSLLSLRYPAVVDLADAARECARAHQTLLNELSAGRCKLKCFKQGRRWYVRLVDLADYIDTHALSAQSAQVTPPRKRGRPTKAEAIARRIAIGANAR